jgi:glycyl-tRNA synthetase
MEKKVSLEDIVSLAKRRGFFYQGSEIYGGLSGVYDYGPLGVMLKHNIQNLWWSSFVSSWDDMYPMDAAILMNSKVWKASGHVDTFTDPLEDGSRFNTMFQTSAGVGEETATTYLRPETAQGLFVNFKNVLDCYQPEMPFGLAQIGKGFRNEISPRDFLFRLREFEMMEIEYFVQPDKWQQAFGEWQEGMASFFKKVGLPEGTVHAREVSKDERAHYSDKTMDFEFDFPFGRKELAGLAYRTDYDLKKHQDKSGVSMEYRPKDGSASFIPHVVEPSFGVERLILALLTAAYSQDEQGGEERTFLKFPTEIAPVKVAVFPLLKNKPELVAKSREIYKMLKEDLGEVMWDDNGNIGKRYRRQDEIGTPHCITVDFQSLEDDTVTLRNRDTTEQKRVGVPKITEFLS